MAQAHRVLLRAVVDTDVEAFYEHQADPAATALAAFPFRDRETFFRHWRDSVAQDNVVKRTVTYGDAVAGYVACFAKDDLRLVGYWLDRAFWGRGIATAALSAFLDVVRDRPLHAFVAKSNAPSIRVLEKCGFERLDPSDAPGDVGAEEWLYVRVD